MKDILEYTSYRQYIADYYAEKKAKSAFTWQEFTRAAGFSSPVHLKYASEGRLNLSDAAALRVAKAMHLVDFDLHLRKRVVRRLRPPRSANRLISSSRRTCSTKTKMEIIYKRKGA